jgi:hypothetical protein
VKFVSNLQSAKKQVMPFTITHPLGRVPTYPEIQALARRHEVQLTGNEQAGDFQHPDREQPKVTGHYIFEPNGNLHGDFISHVLGKLAGTFEFNMGQAGITITQKPFLLPEAVLKSRLSEELEKFCAQFPPAA